MTAVIRAGRICLFRALNCLISWRIHPMLALVYKVFSLNPFSSKVLVVVGF